jgi:hypothetical protein
LKEGFSSIHQEHVWEQDRQIFRNQFLNEIYASFLVCFENLVLIEISSSFED